MFPEPVITNELVERGREVWSSAVDDGIDGLDIDRLRNDRGDAFAGAVVAGADEQMAGRVALWLDRTDDISLGNCGSFGAAVYFAVDELLNETPLNAGGARG